jgi:mRNA interferase MazF
MTQKNVTRGDVVWIDFDQQENATMTKRRPAVVIQNDVANRHANSVIVAAIRHDTGKKLPVHVELPAGEGGLTKDSMIDMGHIATVPYAAIGGVVGHLGFDRMAEVGQAIRISLSVR